MCYSLLEGAVRSFGMFTPSDFQKRILKPVTKVGSNELRFLVEDRLRQAS